MVEISYSKLSSNIKANSGLVKLVNYLDKTITIVTVILYLGLLVYSFFFAKNGDYTIFYRSILIPGVSFIVVSIFRKIVSAPRPYEVYGFTPVISKDTVGKSFPSRHVFSIFMVAMTYLQVSNSGAVILFFMGIVLAFLRVCGGVHFLKDVIAGAIIGIVCGILGYYVIGDVLNLCTFVI